MDEQNSENWVDENALTAKYMAEHKRGKSVIITVEDGWHLDGHHEVGGEG